MVNGGDNDKKVINWGPIFMDCLSRTYGSNGPLVYILREDIAVSTEAIDPIQVDHITSVTNRHFGKSGSS